MSKSVYEIVTEKVLDAMDKGTLPWRKPWDANGLRPSNAESMRPYSGGNMFLLSMLPFATPAFLTFNQIKKAGATIKPGEEKKHYPVFRVFYFVDLAMGCHNHKHTLVAAFV